MHCDLIELKAVLELNFGNWEIFRLLINGLREIERSQPSVASSKFHMDAVGGGGQSMDTMDTFQMAPPQAPMQRQKTTIEKQVCVLEINIR